jgi:hypothetical protein
VTRLELPFESIAELRARAELANNDLRLYLAGTADLRVSDEMRVILTAVHQQAQKSRISVVSIDLTELEFMNSSCFKAFVFWLGELQELPAERRYRLRFIQSPHMLWQRRSLHALRCFASELVSIEQAPDTSSLKSPV